MLKEILNCKNCQEAINKDHKYCPKCGQKNNQKLSLRTLFNDTINNYFSFDSLFINSLIPLLFRTAYLAKEYIDGKRLKYIHPGRAYLFTSVVFFFFFSFLFGNQEVDLLLNSDQENVDSLLVVNEKDSLKNTNTFKIELDTLTLMYREKGNMFEKYFANKVLKIQKKHGEGILRIIYRNIPVILFFQLPFFALILRLLFFKKSLCSPLNLYALLFLFFIFILIFIFIY